MIRLIRGILRNVTEEELILAVDPIEVELLVPEYTRRQLQSKIGELVALHTIFYIEGGQMASRLIPRLAGFLTPIEMQFFDVFCSVDGVGVKKALRAMVRPVREIARTIQDQDVKMLATYPGIGEATAERIVAKLRRKVGIFTLIVSPEGTAVPAEPTAESNGSADSVHSDVLRDTFAALLSVGHNESQARQAIDRVLSTAGRKKFKSVADMIDAIYQQNR